MKPPRNLTKAAPPAHRRREIVALAALVSAVAVVTWFQSQPASDSSPAPEAQQIIPIDVSAATTDRHAPATQMHLNPPEPPAEVKPESPAASEDRQEIFRRVRQWAAMDFTAAFAWATNLSDSDDRSEALEAVCYGLAETAPADAVQLAVTLQLEERPGAAVENLVMQWAMSDTAAAFEWAQNQPAGERREAALARVAFVMAESDPASAARLVAEELKSDAAQAEAAIMVLHRWALRDLEAAANWVRQFPEGAVRNRAVAELEGILEERKS